MTDVVEEPVDHTQDFQNLIACKTFATYSELTDAIKEFEFNTKTRFIVRSCRKRYPADQLVYDTMSFRCQHYDVKRRSTSLGFRRTRTRLMLFCPVRFSVRASEHGLVVSHYTMLHNHSLITDNADWRRISDQLKSVGNKKTHVSTCLKRLKACMRRELVSTDSLRSPRRKKIQECTSSSYFLTTELVHHCVRNPLPTLLAKFRRFELGFEQREPERLISQLEALIKRFYTQHKSPSYVLRSGSKLAEAVRDVICAECLMLAYQDMYVCHLCAWRAHKKCSTRAGISDICPRCTIDSKLTYVKERIPLYHVDSMSLTQTEVHKGRRMVTGWTAHTGRANLMSHIRDTRRSPPPLIPFKLRRIVHSKVRLVRSRPFISTNILHKLCHVTQYGIHLSGSRATVHFRYLRYTMLLMMLIP
ncbi:hypothetical protein AHF37_01165 [Paragonimus kellicotti]|nr:hypothetical protein AHF37_01165 [Paragonimus kellicotti]